MGRDFIQGVCSTCLWAAPDNPTVWYARAQWSKVWTGLTRNGQYGHLVISTPTASCISFCCLTWWSMSFVELLGLLQWWLPEPQFRHPPRQQYHLVGLKTRYNLHNDPNRKRSWSTEPTVQPACWKVAWRGTCNAEGKSGEQELSTLKYLVAQCTRGVIDLF